MQTRDSDRYIAQRLEQSFRELGEDHTDAELLALRRFLVPINPDPVTAFVKRDAAYKKTPPPKR